MRPGGATPIPETPCGGHPFGAQAAARPKASPRNSTNARTRTGLCGAGPVHRRQRALRDAGRDTPPPLAGDAVRYAAQQLAWNIAQANGAALMADYMKSSGVHGCFGTHEANGAPHLVAAQGAGPALRLGRQRIEAAPRAVDEHHLAHALRQRAAAGTPRAGLGGRVPEHRRHPCAHALGRPVHQLGQRIDQGHAACISRHKISSR
ncbi:hypothetical protein [Pseudorhodoferax sp.]|uniref:hypothetical protein n=1 Tax=Pseudorhodoferax sp. TaxID=1993553 RepID=UPI0039E3C592